MALTGQRNPGFTRIELLVVMCIMFLLMSTSLPAVLQLWGKSRLDECKDNLKQLGLAMHNYHDVHNYFPMSWSSTQLGIGKPAIGWQAKLLPYLDHAEIHNQLLRQENTYPSGQAELLKKTIPELLCPDDQIGPVNPMRGGLGTSSYVGNFGSTPIPRWGETSTGAIPWPGTVQYSGEIIFAKADFDTEVERRVAEIEKLSGNDKREAAFELSVYKDLYSHFPGYGSIQDAGNLPRSNGIVTSVNQCSGVRDIIDGTSNTIMAGERAAVGRGAIWAGVNSNTNESDLTADASEASPLNRVDTGFSSWHEGVVPFLMCDGAVRQIRDDIEHGQGIPPGILQLLASRNDGEPIPEF